MRAIWKGAVAFGLVNVPVKLYAATGEHEVPLHQVHKDDGGRIRPFVSATYPLDAFKDALRAKWHGDIIGGCVLHP